MIQIDADALKIYYEKHGDCDGSGRVYDSTIDCIDAQPTIEAEPVVRCGDCEHGKSFANSTGGTSIHCSIFQTGMSQTGFCSMGKHMKGGDK